MKRSPLPEILTLLRLSVDDMDVSYHQSVPRDTLMMGPPHRLDMRADQEQITKLFFRQAQKRRIRVDATSSAENRRSCTTSRTSWAGSLPTPDRAFLLAVRSGNRRYGGMVYFNGRRALCEGGRWHGFGLPFPAFFVACRAVSAAELI